MDMSSAVPRLKGTRGVSSNATIGLNPRVDGLVNSVSPDDVGGEVFISKASIRPPVTMTLHSSGFKLSHAPLSDQPKMDATVLEAPPAGCGIVLYGVYGD